jgi:hypothetical protein
LTASQLSKRLGGKPTARTLLAHARNGWIPSLKSGKRVVRFDLEAVKAKMNENGRPK